MKECEIRRRRPYGSVTPSLQKIVITDHDIRLRTPEILLQLKRGRIQKIIHKDDGGVLDKIESVFHRKAKSLGDLASDLVAFQFALEGLNPSGVNDWSVY